MTMQKKYYIIALILFCSFSLHAHSAQSKYHSTTDTVVDLIGEAFYPVKKMWSKIMETFSPHHPIIKDIKETADHVARVAPKVASEVSVMAEKLIEEARNKTQEISDYALQKAEETTQRMCDNASDKILDASSRALDHTQKAIESSVHNATEDAVIQAKTAHQELMAATQVYAHAITHECTQKIEESVDRATTKACTDIQLASDHIMHNVNHQLTLASKNMVQEFSAASELMADNVAQRIGQESKKSITFAAKSALILSGGLASLAISTFGTHKYMYHSNPQDLGFIALGIAGIAAAYHALESVGTQKDPISSTL